MDEIREVLLNLPLSHVVLSVFLAACALGAAFTLISMAIRALPDTLRELHLSRLQRENALEEQPVWAERRPAIQPGRE